MRKLMIEKRKALEESIKAEADRIICNKILTLLLEDYKEIDNILCYYPLAYEINLLPLYEELLKYNKKLYFPKTTGDEMEFYKVVSLEEFEEGNFHVMVPLLCDKEHIFIYGKAIGIIPGLVFDRDYNRMGYGKGYYDKYLGKKAEIVKIAPCYSFQIVDKIEAKSWDVKMDFLVTD